MFVATSDQSVANRIELDEHYLSSRQIFYLAVAFIFIVIFSSLDRK